MEDQLELTLSQVNANFTPDDSKWKLARNVSGPAISCFMLFLFVVALFFNSFIIGNAIYDRKQSFSNSSIIFLFNFALSDLLTALFYMPFVVIASGAEEWIFGSTDQVRTVLCQIHAIIFLNFCVASNYILVVISFDRFLYIVKASIYDKIMTWKVAVTIMSAIWMIAVVFSIVPNFIPQLGAYNWSVTSGGCLPLWTDNQGYIIIFGIVAVIPFLVVMATTLSTSLFTCGFLKKNLRRHTRTLRPERLAIQQCVYSRQITNLFGIFGALLVFHVISWTPFFVVLILGLTKGFETSLHPLYTVGFVTFFINGAVNPIVQIYFRRDLLNSFKKLCRSLYRWTMAIICCRHQIKEHDTEGKLQHIENFRDVQTNRGDKENRQGSEKVTFDEEAPNLNSEQTEQYTSEGTAYAQPEVNNSAVDSEIIELNLVVHDH